MLQARFGPAGPLPVASHLETSVSTTKIQIPVLNMRHYTDGTPEQKAAFVKTWGEGLKDLGFVAIEQHHVDHDLIRRTYQLFEAFYALPRETKERYGGVAGGQRGFTGFMKEHAKDNSVGDLKEFWHVGRELSPGHPMAGSYPANVWPEELPELRDVTLALFDQLEANARILLRALGDYFELEDRDYFVKAVENGNHIMRAIHYPPLQPGMPDNAVRAAAHEDINMITILCEATSAGLEILTRDNEWVAIDALAGQLVVDAGDMLSRLTNQVIPATTHRVVNPVGENTVRYSLPYFVHPYSEFNIECLPCCDTPERPRRFEPITAGAFLQQRLREIGLLK
jgi:isopenicillin N synthase-like dioxygenase